MVPLERVKKFKFFVDAPAALLEKLSRDMTEKKVNAGDIICKEDAPGGNLYIIEAGKVKVEKRAFSGESSSKVVARLGAGEFFGEMSFLQNLPHSATVSAEEASTLFVLSPESARDQILMVAMGLSNRLRSTTRELVTVYEVARAVAVANGIDELARLVVGQLCLDLGATTSVAFYRWNMFNDEYALLTSGGTEAAKFPATIEPQALTALPFQQDLVLTSPIDMLNQRQGLLVYVGATVNEFDAGERQMMDTVAGVLAPAIASASHREEEILRQRLAQNKQAGYGL